ncbi:MAG: dTDP-glucose 4,6-dehydratase [Terriglobales bacterium]
MKRWLITGGCGFIGSHFIGMLLDERPEALVCNLDLLTYAAREDSVAAWTGNPRYQFVRADIADAAEVEHTWQQFAPDVVVHFAAETHVDRSITAADPFIRTNVLGTQVLLDAARRHRTARFVHVGTDEVYGSVAAPQRAGEDAPLAPSSPYAASKAAADLLVGAAVATYALPAVITRGANTYGPRQYPEKFIPLAIARALASQPIPLYGDGGQVRCWLHVADHCRGVLAAAERGTPGRIYNLGSEEELTNRALLQQLLQLLQRPDSLVQTVTDRPGHDRRYALDSRLAQKDLAWRPQVALGEGLRQTVQWYSAHPEWLAILRSKEFRDYYRRQYDGPASSSQP